MASSLVYLIPNPIINKMEKKNLKLGAKLKQHESDSYNNLIIHNY